MRGAFYLNGRIYCGASNGKFYYLFVASSHSGALYEMGFNGVTVTTQPVQDIYARGGWAGRAAFVAQYAGAAATAGGS